MALKYVFDSGTSLKEANEVDGSRTAVNMMQKLAIILFFMNFWLFF